MFTFIVAFCPVNTLLDISDMYTVNVWCGLGLNSYMSLALLLEDISFSGNSVLDCCFSHL